LPAVRFTGDSIWNIEDRMKHYGVPGLSLAVIKDSKIIWIKNYGVIDQSTKVPVTNNTLFQAASISKPVSAYAALHLVDLGKIDAEGDVDQYLKAWKIPDDEFTKEKQVNLKGLLSHSSGLTVHGFPGYPSGTTLPSLQQVLDGEAPANTGAIRVDKEPGGYFRYSGGAYTVLQQLLMDVEGKPFPQIMQETVIIPLGMKNATFNQPLNATQLKMAATGYLPDGKEVPTKRHVYPELAAAGLWTTSEDLGKFVVDVQQAINGKSNKVLSPTMAEAFTSPYLEPFEGLGLFLEKKGDQHYFNHGGWNEGFSSKIIGSKNSGDGVVVLTNGNQPMLIEEIIRAVADTYQWPGYESAILQQQMITKADFDQITGKYLVDKYGTFTVYEQDGRLFLINNMEKPVELFKVDDNTYALRDWDFKVKFLVNPEDQKRNLVRIQGDAIIRYEHPLLSPSESTPFELIHKGNFDRGLAAFLKAKAVDPNHNLLSEGYINMQGYRWLQDKELAAAIDLFRVNTFLYPNAENTFDSLAEAYLLNGDTKRAKENWLLVLQLNPKHENAIKQLKKLD